MQVFYDRHMCRVVPNPPEVQASMAATDEDPTVYHTMNGPTVFHIVGSLREWSVIDRLQLIEVPTLVVSRRYDEATPTTVRPYVDEVPDARWRNFAESSHMPRMEETGDDAYPLIRQRFIDGFGGVKQLEGFLKAVFRPFDGDEDG